MVNEILSHKLLHFGLSQVVAQQNLRAVATLHFGLRGGGVEKKKKKRRGSVTGCLNHTRWHKKRHKTQVIWIYDLAHMLSAGASAASGGAVGAVGVGVAESCSRPNESGNFALGCHRDGGCKITAHYTKVTPAPGPVITAA